MAIGCACMQRTGILAMTLILIPAIDPPRTEKYGSKQPSHEL